MSTQKRHLHLGAFIMLTDVVVLALVIYALLGKFADLLAKTLESLTLQWHPALQKPAKGRPS